MSDADERAVLADELQQRGEPLGELIALSLALEGHMLPVRRNLIERQIANNLDTHHDYYYGALAPHARRLSAPDILDPAIVVETWNRGLPEAIQIQRRVSGPDLGEIVPALRAAPIARMMRRLDIGVGDHVAAAEALDRDPPPTLRELVISPYSSGRVWHALTANVLPDLGTLARVLAQLELAAIRTELHQWTPFASSTLRQLVVVRSWEHFGTSDVVFEAQLDAIEDIEVRAFQIPRGFFDRYPTLRHAYLSSVFPDNFLEQLVWSRIDPRLESIHLHGRFRRTDIDAFVRDVERVGRLEIRITPAGGSLPGFDVPPLPSNVTIDRS